MTVKNQFLKNGDGKIHLIEVLKPGAPQILLVPGMFGIAEHCTDEFSSLAEFSLTAMSVRGRGQSSREFSDWSFAAHVSDVVTVIDSRPDGKMTLFAHSFGCALAVAAAGQRPERINSLVLIDKGLRAKEKIPSIWLERVRSNPPPTSTVEVAEKVLAASEPMDLMPTLRSLSIPILYVKGEAEGHHLTEAEAQELAEIPNVTLFRAKNSGHFPIDSDYRTFIGMVRDLCRDPRPMSGRNQ